MVVPIENATQAIEGLPMFSRRHAPDVLQLPPYCRQFSHSRQFNKLQSGSPALKPSRNC